MCRWGSAELFEEWAERIKFGAKARPIPGFQVRERLIVMVKSLSRVLISRR